MRLSTIIARVGDENVLVQSLVRDITEGKITRNGATVTFATAAERVSDLNKAAALGRAPAKVGIVVWIDADRWTAAHSSKDVCHGLDTPSRVFFYEQDFYVLSNFSSFRVKWKGLSFDTSEHAYHWEKFPDHPALRNAVRYADSAHESLKIATANKMFRRADWDAVKADIMREIIREKARQHEYVRRKLLATGDRELVENSWRDDFWGWGPNRDGKNTLGKLWMEVRAELRAEGAV